MNALTIKTRLPLPASAGVTAQQWRVLTDAIFPSAKTPEAVCLALDYCKARRLDVFKRPVHIVPMWNSSLRREVETVWPSINELQTTAGRTGKWAGMDSPEWGPLVTHKFEGVVGKRGEERQVKVEVTFPEWCSVTVYRLVNNQRYAFSEPVFWMEAYSRIGRSDVPNDMWRKRPRGQLHKNAKAAALRAAFPEDVGNDYAAEEMEGKETESGGVVIDADPSSFGDVEDNGSQDFRQPAESDGMQDAQTDVVEYYFDGPEGSEALGTGTEWIAKWRGTIDECKKTGALSRLRAGAKTNQSNFNAVKEFDPDAVSKVLDMLSEALSPRDMELPA